MKNSIIFVFLNNNFKFVFYVLILLIIVINNSERKISETCVLVSVIKVNEFLYCMAMNLSLFLRTRNNIFISFKCLRRSGCLYEKAKEIAKCVAVASVIMSGSFSLQATSAFADSKGTVENLQNGGKVYNSFKTTYDMKQNIKNSIKVSFIEDPYADKRLQL